MRSGKYKLLTFLVLGTVLITLSGCSYSFTGASVPPHLKTLYIPTVRDLSGKGEATLAEDLTNELVNKFVSDNSFQIMNTGNSDAVLECSISSLTEGPDLVEAGEVISNYKLTLTVKVVYRDLVKKEIILDNSVSDFALYNTDGDTYQARLDAITEVVEKIADEILINVVSNW